MTNDKLERFILENRDQFDTLEPTERVWNAIANPDFDKEIKLTHEPKRYRISSLKWATRVAAAVLLFVGSYYFHDYRSQQEEDISVASQVNENRPLYNTMVEAEYYYTAQINVETEKMYQLTVGNTMVREEIQNELEELDKEFRELKEDLKDNADNEDIIAAMIQNYRLKLRILQDMMDQLQQIKKDKSTNNEIKRIQI